LNYTRSAHEPGMTGFGSCLPPDGISVDSSRILRIFLSPSQHLSVDCESTAGEVSSSSV